jgi:hypothetical protein
MKALHQDPEIYARYGLEPAVDSDMLRSLGAFWPLSDASGPFLSLSVGPFLFGGSGNYVIDAEDIARHGPLSRSPNVRHGDTGNTR